MMVTDSDFLALDFDSIQEDIKHVWYFELILDHVLYTLEFVVIRRTLTSGSVWSSVM